MSSVIVKRGWVAAVVLTVALVGCGDDDGGAAGTAGDSGGGSGGAAGAAGFGGVGGAGGSGGTAGSDDDAGVSGTGGTAGTAGAGGTAGTAGSGGGCATNCNDNNNCTVDACVNGTCTNTLDDSLCDSGQSCHPTNGCVTGGACSGSTDCADTDGCTTNERCDNALAQCLWDPLDGDNDGFAPRSCGGADCNDADNDVHPGADDVCDGEDNDCDETIDEDATCANGGSCVDGACVCGDLTTCGTGITARCVDTTSDGSNCGACGMSCGSGGTCVDSACQCTSPGALCTVGGPGGGQQCINTNTSQTHCGGCNMPCGTDEFCSGGTCATCGGDGEPCCPAGGSTAGGLSSDGCPGAALVCTGERGSPTSVCGCPSPNEICTTIGPGGGPQCVNTDTATQHCGGCNMACPGGQQCNGGQCSQCGQQVGQPCCVVVFGPQTIYTCPAQAVSCNQTTRVCE